MSIRSKITLFVMTVGLSQAVLIGVIAYNSISDLTRSAAELRRISSAIEGTRSLNSELLRLTDPSDPKMARGDAAPESFSAQVKDLERRVETCSSTTCHGYSKRPPAMAGSMVEELQEIDRNGSRILANRPFQMEAWVRDVDQPARRLSRRTEEMSATLMLRARELEDASRESERRAVVLVSVVMALCVLVSVSLARPIAQQISKPVERLSEESRRFAADGSVRAEESGPAEIVQLARSFNRMAEDVSRQVNAQVAELRRKDEDLKRSERLASIGLVSGMIAHDLNNPLTSVVLNAEHLHENLEVNGTCRTALDDLLADSRRCREFASQIRSLGRETLPEGTPCSLLDLVQEAVRMIRFKWEPRGVRISVGPSPEGATCLCSAPHLVEVIMNLIDNAVDATPDGGVVDVRLRKAPGLVVVEIEDHGPGIPPSARESLFRPFFTTKAGGTGLGLAISRRIVEQHHGTVEFDTRTADEGEPSGTVFRISLPSEESKRACCESERCRPGRG